MGEVPFRNCTGNELKADVSVGSVPGVQAQFVLLRLVLGSERQKLAGFMFTRPLLIL